MYVVGEGNDDGEDDDSRPPFVWFLLLLLLATPSLKRGTSGRSTSEWMMKKKSLTQSAIAIVLHCPTRDSLVLNDGAARKLLDWQGGEKEERESAMFSYICVISRSAFVPWLAFSSSDAERSITQGVWIYEQDNLLLLLRPSLLLEDT